MPLTLRAPWPNLLVTSCLLLFLMDLQQLCMALHYHSSQLSAQECSALAQLARQSNLSTNCNCTQLSSLNLISEPCDARCMQTRRHFVNCTGGYSVSELYLSNMSLKGNLTWVTNFKHIKHLDVSLNHFSGNLPHAIWSLGQLTYVNLSFNSLNGSIPNFYDSESSTYSYPLRALDFSHNQIGGPFPQNLCIKFPNLTQLILSSNTFNGSANLSLCDRLEAFDASFNRLQGPLLEHLQPNSSLKSINLQHNMFNGSIPHLSGLPQLVNLDVSFNNFSGIFGSENYTLPLNLSKLDVSHNNLEVGFNTSLIFKFGLSSFWPNTACKECYVIMAPSPSPSPSVSGAADSPPPSMLSQRRSDFSIKTRVDVILGIIVGSTTGLILLTIILCIIVQKRRRKTAWPLCRKHPVPPFKHVPELGPFSFESQSGTWVADVKDPSSVPVVIFEKPLMNLTFSDLLQATKSFDRESEVGDGTGLVYKCVLPGVLEDDAKVTIEVVEDGPSLSAEAAQAAFSAMGEVKHENLVPLLGYCIVGDQKLLIYKHMEGGSLEDVLHVVREEAAAAAQLTNASGGAIGTETEDWNKIESWPDDDDDLQSCNIVDTARCKLSIIEWERRQKIALGVARALAYLHNGCRRPSVVHGALTSSCILLDGSLQEAMVANYGGAWGLRRRLAAGYVAPECMESAHMAASYSLKRTSNSDAASAYTSKCDVYGVGVVLLELATGRRAVGNYGAASTLVAWVRSLKKGKRAEEAIDGRLPAPAHPYLLEMIHVGCLCTADSPSKRPSMQQVVGLLKDLTPL